MSGLVFVVDDDRDHLLAASDLIEAAGYDVLGFAGAADALSTLDTCDPDVIVCDLRMPGMDGMDLIAAVNARGRDHPVIVITGHGDVPQAVAAIREGAEDFLEKPYNADHLLLIIGRAIKAREMRAELSQLKARLPGDEIIGDSPAIAGLRAKVSALASIDVNVVVTGETGTGKELIARNLHSMGPRGRHSFIALNCAAVPEGLFEIEMFGCAAGAFPNAVADKPGKLELANGGTLLLDEIDMMSPPIQAKMLRVLEEQSVMRLGENWSRALDIRVVATSKTSLKARTMDGGFRADLYYRLAGAEIVTTPLRDMAGDIALLFAHFAAQAARRHSRLLPDIPIGLRARLARRSWPGNARELRAAAERFVLGLDLAEADQPPSDVADATTLPERIAAFEAREIHAALVQCRGSTERAADLLGLPRRTLNDKIKRLGLKV